jgi:cell shape-determining protein MreD
MASFLLAFGPGFAAVFAAGLACDANAGVPFGTHALLFALVHCILFHFRDRLPHDTPAGRVLICLACNMALFIALTLQRAYRAPAPAGEGYRVVWDFLFSQIAVAVAGPWFYHLQRRALALARAEPVRSLL